MKTNAKKSFQLEIEKQARAELKNARVNVKKYLEGAILSLLGLEKKYNNDYEIDHCNGRNGVLIDAFRELAITEARKIAAGYKPTKEELNIFEEAFRKELKSQFYYAIRDAAKVKAVQAANEAAEKMKVDIDQLLEEEFGTKPEVKK